MAKRYAIRFADTLIPTAEVTVPEVRSIQPYVVAQSSPVKRFRGFTETHAYNRALAWTRAHGDPR